VSEPWARIQKKTAFRGHLDHLLTHQKCHEWTRYRSFHMRRISILNQFNR
jgi:hypothetical protein